MALKKTSDYAALPGGLIDDAWLFDIAVSGSINYKGTANEVYQYIRDKIIPAEFLLERQLIGGSDYRLNPKKSLNDRYNTNTAYQIGGIDVLSVKGINNTCVGADTDGAITTGQDNVFIGKSSGNFTDTGSYNCYLGFESGYTGTSAQFNTAFGYKTLRAITNASNNCVFGNAAGSNITSGGRNCLFGASAGLQTTIASNTIGIGYQAGRINNADYLVAIGYRAGNANLASLGNTYVGKDAGYIATGANNSIFGYESGSALTSGANNTLYGYQTGLALTTQSGNVHLGYLAGSQSTESDKLYIDNTNTTTPLIKGDFAGNSLNFRGISSYYAHPTFTYGSFELIDAKYLNDIQTDSRMPTGFVDRVATLNFTSGSLTFEINGAHDIYIKGKKYSKTTTQKIISGTSGVHWIYYDSAGVIQESTSFPNLSDNVLISYVYWNPTTAKGLVYDERHGCNRSIDWHVMHHFTIGCLYGEGLDGTFTDTTFSVGPGSIYDEDIKHSITTKTTCNILYKNGSAEFVWDLVQTSIYKTVTGVIQYNNGTTLANVPNNSYVAYWVFATGDVYNPIYSVMGQRVDANLPAARINNVVNNLTFGSFPAVENRLLYRVIYRNVGGTPTYIETEDLRKVTQIPGSPYIATSHQALSELYLATTGVVYGHIDDQPQTIYGAKTFFDELYAKNGDFQFGTLDPGFSAPQIWNKSTNAIVRIGSSTLSGDPTNVPAVGYVAYGKNYDLDPMDANNQSQFNILPYSGFTFINVDNGTSVITYAYNAVSGQITTKDNANNPTFLFNRLTGLGTYYAVQKYNTHPNFTPGSTEFADVKFVEDHIQPTLKAVIDFIDFTTNEPPAPSIGDRWIATVTGVGSIHPAWNFTKDYIYEWNGTTYTETIPGNGVRLYVTTLNRWYTYTGSSWEVDTGDLKQQQFYCAMKAGSDTVYDGKSYNEPFVTPAKAMTTISGLTPGAGNQFKVDVIDAGIYSGAVTMQPYTELNAPGAIFTGTITMVDNSVLHCKRTTGLIQKTAGSGTATVIVDEEADNNGAAGSIAVSSGTLNVITNNAKYGANYMIGSVTTGNTLNFACKGKVNSTTNGLFVNQTGGGTINLYLPGEVNGNTGTIFQTGGSGGFVNVYGNYIHADGTGGKIYNITSGAVMNFNANRVTEHTASTKVGATVNKCVLLDTDNKSRFYNDVVSQGTSLQNFTFYNGTMINSAGSTIGFQSVATLTGGLDPSYKLSGRTIGFTFDGNASTAVRCINWVTSSTTYWQYGQYGDNNLKWRYTPSSRVDMMLDTSGDIWMYGVPGNVVAGAVLMYINAAGYVGTIVCNREAKTNIKPITDYRWILDVQNYTFNYRKEERVGKDKKLTGRYTDEHYDAIEAGQIVDEVEKIQKDKIFKDKDGKPKGIHYEHYKFYMLELLKEHDRRIETLENEIKKLKGVN